MNKIVAVLLSLMITSSSGEISQTLQEPQNNTVEIVIFPTSSMNETYCIGSNKDAMLTVRYGQRKNDAQPNCMLTIQEERKKELSKSEYERMQSITGSISDGELTLEEVLGIDDGWIVAVITDKPYYFQYSDMQNTELAKVVEEIKGLSPIEIDIHGWS